jgi:hypothetical protein
MNEFPVLKSGAVMQYSGARQQRFSTRVLRFLDGGEQRFRQFETPLKRWLIRLAELDETELAALEAFFLAEQGGYGTFSFVDPFDGTPYPDCSLDNPEAFFECNGIHDGRTQLVVRQNR